jgi:5'-nucleotidase
MSRWSTSREQGTRPLILLTNDDGIASPGLHALARAVADLGDVIVVAPRHQQSSTGRALGPIGPLRPERIPTDGHLVTAYSVEATPASAVRAGVLLAAQRPVTLLIAGINYGENVGIGVTASGTVGCAIEAASFGIPSIAISLETDTAHHFSHSEAVDFAAAAAFARRLAQYALARPFPPGADILKVDVPSDATPETPWRLTRLTRQRYYEPTVVEGPDGSPRLRGYHRHVTAATLEPDSDAKALLVDRGISVCPLTIDLSVTIQGGTEF